MVLTEQHLESQVSVFIHLLLLQNTGMFRCFNEGGFILQNVTKGARHKIALSIQKLRERQCVLKSLEKVSRAKCQAC